MIESEATEPQSGEGDPVITALTTLSHVAKSSADGLLGLDEDLTTIREQRLSGWSWRRIMDHSESAKPLSSITEIASTFARASGGFRRALAVGLRKEGLQVSEVAALFDVSRQRVSALLRPRDAEGTEQAEQLID
jgi:hypothetical protein